MKKKILTIVGTRPEIIRLSNLLNELDSAFTQVLVHTGQNWQDSLNKNFFSELKVRSPDYSLDCDSSSPGRFLGELFVKSEKLIQEVKPDAAVILGDTNSALVAILLEKMGVPVFHFEAGNRCFDERVPEELNRRLVDTASSFNVAYTRHAVNNLIKEGHHFSRLAESGSPLTEVIAIWRDEIDRSTVLEELELNQGHYFVASLHRQETVNNPDLLQAVFNSFELLNNAFGFRVILSLHPRTLNKLEEFQIPIPSCVEVLEPLGFFDYCKLQLHSACVISDSGSLSEEADILGFRAVTCRDSIERPEAIEAGVLTAAGTEPNRIFSAVSYAMIKEPRSSQVRDYVSPDFSKRATSIILSQLK